MKIEIIHFKATDGVKNKGLLYKGENNNKIIISIHGMATTCIKERDEQILKKAQEINIDYLAFNNRGSEIVKYISKSEGKRELAGTAYEDVEESYSDIVGAINFCISKKYEEIYLLGHSLGSTKIVYTYNKLIENKEEEILNKIKGIIILSLIDIPKTLQIYLNNNFANMLTYAKNMEKEHMENILMPEKSFIHPISIKTFLKYARDYKNINFARYSEENYDFKELNAIKVPLFMRWGNINEMIIQKPENLCEFLKSKINSKNLDIGYIEGANHSYLGKEELLAEEIQNFLKKKV